MAVSQGHVRPGVLRLPLSPLHLLQPLEYDFRVEVLDLYAEGQCFIKEVLQWFVFCRAAAFIPAPLKVLDGHGAFRRYPARVNFQQA